VFAPLTTQCSRTDRFTDFGLSAWRRGGSVFGASGKQRSPGLRSILTGVDPGNPQALAFKTGRAPAWAAALRWACARLGRRPCPVLARSEL